jgi:hypothetical protein
VKVVTRRGRGKTVCARSAYRAHLGGPSTSPLAGAGLTSSDTLSGADMPNGSPGDDPYTDVVIHGLEVYSARATVLIHEIAKLADERTRRWSWAGSLGNAIRC